MASTSLKGVSDARSQQVSPAASLPLQRSSRAGSSSPEPAPARARRRRAEHSQRPRRHAAGAPADLGDPLLPGRAVVILALLATTTLAILDRSWTGRLSQFFDLCFVLVCIVAALAVRRSGLFTVGVMPPLVMVAVLAVFAVVDPGTLTAQHVGVVTTLLAGLAHHAAALVAGHGSALAILVARGTVGAEPSRSP